MAVTIEKKFWNGSEYKDIAKVVFTSPNFSSPATAGTRSHIQPGGEYIGTWYEAVDFLYRQKPNQNYVDYPTEMESIFGKLTCSGTFDIENDSSALFWHKYGEDYPVIATGASQNIIYYDKNSYGVIASCVSGTTTRSGVEVYTANVTFTYTVGSGIVTNDEPMYHQYSDVTIDSTTTEPRIRRQYGANSVAFEVTFGEAYDCRLTAWDDDTHATTNNKILDEEHYRVDVVTYRANDSEIYNSILKSNRCLVYPPSYDQVLKGNEKYYGDFDLIYVIEANEYGEYLVFLPRLVNMNDTFAAGNYDFVTTLHYQYT